MATEAEFQAAVAKVQDLSTPPSTSDLLALYGLYKQSTVGDVMGSRPGMLDMKGRAKYDAWAGHKGKSAEQARQAYIDLVERLVD